MVIVDEYKTEYGFRCCMHFPLNLKATFHDGWDRLIELTVIVWIIIPFLMLDRSKIYKLANNTITNYCGYLDY